MTQQRPQAFCSVIGCRKAAVYFQYNQSSDTTEPPDEGLCEPCYLNLLLTRPDLAANYRRVNKGSNALPHSQTLTRLRPGAG
jgi:hypothetical protein